MAYQSTAKTEAKRAWVRTRIIEESMKLVYQGGFSTVSISKVAVNAGIATGTVYRHFESKSELCTEIFKINTEIEVNKVAEVTRGGGDPATKMREIIEQFAGRAIKGRNLAWALIAEPLDASLEVERLRYRKSYADIFTQLISVGVKQKVFSQQVPEISAAALVGALAEALVGPLSPTSEKNFTDAEQTILIQSMVQFCLGAVGYRGEVQ